MGKVASLMLIILYKYLYCFEKYGGPGSRGQEVLVCVVQSADVAEAPPVSRRVPRKASAGVSSVTEALAPRRARKRQEAAAAAAALAAKSSCKC